MQKTISHHKANNNDPNHSANNNNKHSNLIAFLVLCFVLLGLLVYLNHVFDIFSSMEDMAHALYGILLILVVSSAISRGNISQNIKNLMLWLCIFFVCIIGYTYRTNLLVMKEKVLAELIPDRGVQIEKNIMRFPVSSDGHFYLRIKVNGVPIRFLADTGASHIVLSPKDANKLGFDLNELVFDRFYETANGTIRGSLVEIERFEIGDFCFKKIGASINEKEMRHSLLGMSFFNRLDSYEVKHNTLTLRL